MIRKNRKRIIGISILALIVGYFGLAFRGSAVNNNFPVPKGAELTRQEIKEGYEQYEWNPASEENGLPVYYMIVIRIWGWKQESRFGATTYYEKQRAKISVTSLTECLFISIEE